MTKTLQLSALSLALLCAGISGVHAQASRSLPDDRNLSVQRVLNPQPRVSAQRIALVIGNASYKEAPLINPVNDARAIAQALRESGFTVILRENADQRGILGALREFGDRLRAGGTGLFYYAGHGMQIKGRNYLIPVGASIEREDEVAYSAVDAQAVLDKMEAAGNGANIMILDACRNNPFTRSTRSGQAGLAQMDAPVGTLVAFATSPGAVASDGAGSNGLYTQHLLDAMRKEGSKVEDVFKQVRANVRRDSQGKQVPWEATSLEGDFYFRGGAAASAPRLDLEQALWDAVKDSKVPIELRAYLNRYPTGRFAEQAKQKIGALQQQGVAPTAQASATPAPAVKPVSNPIVNPSVSVTPVIPSQADDLQEDVDKRTEELLKQLAVSPNNPAQQAAVVQTLRPAAATNNAGFTVGDRWRFQVVDKFKGEVVRNYGRQIRAFSNSEMIIAKDEAHMDMRGDWVLTKNSERYRRLTLGSFRLPQTLQTGYKQDFQFSYTDTPLQGGSSSKVDIKGSYKVVGRETIRTPAGEFNAWKIEREEFWQSQTDSNNRGRYFNTSWYVPELRDHVVVDEDVRGGRGEILRRERHELTSYSVRGADEALAKR